MKKTTIIESSFARLGTRVSGRLYKFVMRAKLRKKKIAIKNLRAHMLFFGHDVSDMTDEEIETGVKNASELFGKAGVTTQQAADGLKLLSYASQGPA